MVLSKSEYDEAKQRINDGQGSDEDRRQVKLFESEQANPAVHVGVTEVPAPVGDGADGARTQVQPNETNRSETEAGEQQADQTSQSEERKNLDDEGRIGDSRRKQADDSARSGKRK